MIRKVHYMEPHQRASVGEKKPGKHNGKWSLSGTVERTCLKLLRSSPLERNSVLCRSFRKRTDGG